MLEFLIPILYLKKSTIVIVTMGNTIFKALFGDRPMDWTIILQTLVEKLTKGIGKGKTTPICPYMFHLHKEQEILKLGEIIAYDIGADLIIYNCTPDPKPKPEEPEPKANPNLEPIMTLTEKRSHRKSMLNKPSKSSSIRKIQAKSGESRKSIAL